jgi:hypothetical protein
MHLGWAASSLKILPLRSLPFQPRIFFTVNKGLTNDFWFAKMNTYNGMSLQRITEFLDLWTWVSEVNLAEGAVDDIVWKFTTSGEYTATSAYKAQFEGHDTLVYAGGGLEELGSPKIYSSILFLKCRYTVRVWNMIITWLGLTSMDTSSWLNYVSVKEWWKSVIYTNDIRRKSLASLIMLTSCEIWNERNARVFATLQPCLGWLWQRSNGSKAFGITHAVRVGFYL